MIKGFIVKLKRILFPPNTACISCGREAAVDDEGFCLDCRQGLELFNAAPPLSNIEDYTAVFIYNDVSSAMVKRLKYNNAKYLARPLADLIRIPETWSIDSIVPVPLYYKREAKRGFNQSELIAKHLSRRIGVPLERDLLMRTADTKQQANLSEAGRRRNVKNAFHAENGCLGKTILLIDDVRTTGSTLEECAKEMINAGANGVYAATVCFAKPEK